MKSARYHALRDRVLAVVDRVHAEPVWLSFMRDGDQDPARQAREIEAILKVGSGEETSVAGGEDRAWRSKKAAQPSALHVDRAKYPDLVIRKGDKVKAVSRPGEPWFEVLRGDDRGATRNVYPLGEV